MAEENDIEKDLPHTSGGKPEPPSEDKIKNVLTHGGAKSNVMDDRQAGGKNVEPIPDFSAWTWGKRSDIPKKQLPFFKNRIPPEYIPHTNVSGCICATCKISRGEKKQNPGADVSLPVEKIPLVPESPGDKIPFEPITDPEEFLVDIVDEDMAGWIADFPRQIGELIVQMKHLGADVEEAWAENKKEFDRQAKLALKLWQKWAHIPDFKYKLELFFVLMITVNTLKRIVKTVMILKAKTP